MDIENDEMYVVTLVEDIRFLFSSANNKWAIETPEDSFSIDEENLKEDIVAGDITISLADFLKAKSIVEKRLENEKTM